MTALQVLWILFQETARLLKCWRGHFGGPTPTLEMSTATRRDRGHIWRPPQILSQSFPENIKEILVILYDINSIEIWGSVYWFSEVIEDAIGLHAWTFMCLFTWYHTTARMHTVISFYSKVLKMYSVNYLETASPCLDIVDIYVCMHNMASLSPLTCIYHTHKLVCFIQYC